MRRMLRSILLLALAWSGLGADDDAPAPCRLPGEFEKHSFLLVASQELVGDMPDLFADIIGKVQDRVEVLVMVNDHDEETEARKVLSERGVRLRNVRFLSLPHDTIWVRDYGPVLVEGKKGTPIVVDGRYAQEDRMRDEDTPVRFAEALKLPLLKTTLAFEGGNLISNGRGLCVATQMFLNLNSDRDEKAVRAELARAVGAKQIVFLEPLTGEPTGHVDMFAMFASADTILVGEFDPAVDPVNAAVLDRNAAKLARAGTLQDPLRVVRIPMPSHGGDRWRTYTNAVHANGLLLLPVFPGEDEDVRDRALKVLARTMPRTKVVEIDARDLLPFGGLLHCVTLGLGPLKALPATLPEVPALSDPQEPEEEAPEDPPYRDWELGSLKPCRSGGLPLPLETFPPKGDFK